MAKTSFQSVIETLQDESKDFPKKYFSLFSDLDSVSLESVIEMWNRVPRSRKLFLLNGLSALAQSDNLTSFDELAHGVLSVEKEGEIRVEAIRLLQFAEDSRTARLLTNILEHDVDVNTQTEAARELGKFILLGELDELPEDAWHAAEKALLKAANKDDANTELRHAALESLGYSSRPEVETLIDSSFHRDDPAWKASALFAMARSSNPERWEDPVLSMLSNDDARIRVEAVRAAGELNLKDARQILINMLAEDEEDEDVLRAAIWSLSQIGGEDVRTYLEDLASRADDEGKVEFIDEALENLTFNEELENFQLMSFDDLDELDSLEELDEDIEDEDETKKPKKKKK